MASPFGDVSTRTRDIGSMFSTILLYAYIMHGYIPIAEHFRLWLIMKYEGFICVEIGDGDADDVDAGDCGDASLVVPLLQNRLIVDGKMDLMEDMLLLKFVADPGRRNHRCYCPRAPAEVCRQHRLSDVCTMPNARDVDHHDTAIYIPLYHRTGGFTGNKRDIYKSLVYRLFHEGRVVLPDFLEDEPNLCPTFGAIGFDCLLDIDEQIFPVFVLQFYRSFRLIRNHNGTICVRFTIDNVETILTLENFA
ncbi:hypothetical protein Tco_0179208 [Tanacetum coccineum]